MSGAFKTMTLPGPDPTETTRLKLVNEKHGVVAQLSAMTVILGDLDYYNNKSGKLGPDPLRQDADGERLWDKMRTSKKPIGGILMDQTAVAGIGNIYRAEILFKAGVHPEQPGRSVSREGFECLWRHSVLLLQRGFKTGSILTVDEDEAKKLGKPWTRRYVYNHAKCGRCGSKISTWDMQARKVYACTTCQALHLEPGTELAPGRASALKASTPTKQFKSHCAPEAAAQVMPAQMTVKELKAALEGLQLESKGSKAVLMGRLQEAQAAADDKGKKAEPHKAAGPVGGVKPGLDQEEDQPLQGPEPLMGVQHLDQFEQGDLTSGEEAAPVDVDLAQQQAVAPAKMLVPQLKEQLKTFNMPVSGKKGDLVHRLETALAAAAATGHASDAMSPDTAVTSNTTADDAVPDPAARDGHGASASDVLDGQPEDDNRGASDDVRPDGSGEGEAKGRRGKAKQKAVGGVQPGTQGLGDVITAEDAAHEKAAAGEGRNVEHVAEANDLTHTAVALTRKRKPAQKAQQLVSAEGQAVEATKRSRRKQL
ncbi:TPA: hypothetical protein ACH3X1_004646 [Trebouxia sp. C0004]